jgi:hypothetical protein
MLKLKRHEKQMSPALIFWRGLALFALVIGLAYSAEPNRSFDLQPASDAGGRLDSLLSKARSIANVTGTLEEKVGRGNDPNESHPYYRSIPMGVTRADQLGTRHSWTENTSSEIVVYALLIDEIARLVYVESHGEFAVLDSNSSEHWLSIADLLSGKPSRLATADIEVLNVYDIGGDIVDGTSTEVFMLETKPSRNQRFWVDRERGLVLRALWQNTTYQLIGVRTNAEIDNNLFALNLTTNAVPEIAETELSRWWPNTMLAGGSAFLTNAETKALTVFTAARRGDLQSLKKLISDENLNSKDNRGATPLWIAAAYGKCELVEYLISRGANLNSKTEIAGLTPFHIAALNGQKDVVELLLAKGADVNAKTTAGETPLRLALRRGHKEVAALLREHGAKE